MNHSVYMDIWIFVTWGQNFKREDDIRIIFGRPVELEKDLSLITFLIFTKIFNILFSFFFQCKSEPMIVNICIYNVLIMALHKNIFFSFYIF